MSPAWPILLVALGLTTTGCAPLQAWLREMLTEPAPVAPPSDVIDHRFAIEAQRLAARLDVVEQRAVSQDHFAAEAQRIADRLDAVERRVSQAAQESAAAVTAATAKAERVNDRLTKLWLQHHTLTHIATVILQFGFDQWELERDAQATLMRLAKELKANPTFTVELLGYSDTQGTRDYNDNLSQRRVDTVRRFLVQQDIALGRIAAISLGPLSTETATEPQKRRVVARVMGPRE